VEFCPEFEPSPGGRGIHEGLGSSTDEEQRAHSPRRIPWSLKAVNDAKKLAADGFRTISRRSTIARENSSDIRAIDTLARHVGAICSRLLQGTRLMRQLEISSFRSLDIVEESRHPVLGKSAFRCSPSGQISHVTSRGRGRTRKDASSGLVTPLLFAYIYIRVKGNDRAAPWNSRRIKGSPSLRLLPRSFQSPGIIKKRKFRRRIRAFANPLMNLAS